MLNTKTITKVVLAFFGYFLVLFFSAIFVVSIGRWWLGLPGFSDPTFPVVTAASLYAGGAGAFGAWMRERERIIQR